MTHERNRGYGGALLSGFASATKQWVFYTDGDCAVRPVGAGAARCCGPPPTSTSCRATRSAAPTTSPAASSAACTTGSSSFMFGLKIRDTDCDFRLIRKVDARRDHARALVRRDLRGARAQAPGRRRAVRRGRRSTTTRVCTASRSSSGCRRRPHALGPRGALGAARGPAPRHEPSSVAASVARRHDRDVVPTGSRGGASQRRSAAASGANDPVERAALDVGAGVGSRVAAGRARTRPAMPPAVRGTSTRTWRVARGAPRARPASASSSRR